MCLGQKLSERSLQRYKAKGKKCGYIRVWKVVRNNKGRGGYVSDWCAHRYMAGFNHADKQAFCEQDLIHAFKTATSYKGEWSLDSACECLIECLIKPEWLYALSDCALTTKAIVMPAYPKRKVTVREFREAIKGKKVKTYSWEKK